LATERLNIQSFTAVRILDPDVTSSLI